MRPAGGKQVSKLARCLEDSATYLRSKDLPTTAALFFYPDFTRIPPRAYAEIFWWDLIRGSVP